MLIEGNFHANLFEIEQQWRVWDHHLKSNLSELFYKFYNLIICFLAFIVGDQKNRLDLLHQAYTKLLTNYLRTDLLPITLVLFAKHIRNTLVQFDSARSLLDLLFHWVEMLLDGLYDQRKWILEKVYYAFEVHFGTKNIKKDILTVALIEFGNHICQFIEHGEILTCITRAWNHWPHLVLQRCHLILEFFIFFFQIIPFFFASLEFLSYYFVFFSHVVYFNLELI